MASLSSEKNGDVRVRFFGKDGKRKSICGGKLNDRNAARLLGRVEALVSALKTGAILEDHIQQWLITIAGTPMAKKLESTGLIKKQLKLTLEAFIDEYLAFKEQKLKPTTLITLKQTRRRITKFLGSKINISDVTQADAEKYQVFLSVQEKLSDATIARDCKRCREIFDYAKKSRLIKDNPFASLKLPSQENKERMFTITPEMATKVLDACPSLEWKLIFAMARYGGIRMPSELVKLRWQDILWSENKIIIHSPKTAHQGKPNRIIPLFPELKPLLEQAFDAAPEGSVNVIKHCQGTKNYRKGLKEIILKAGLLPWPKLFNNLRSTRETELAKNYSLQAATAWIGNTPKIALGHYLQVTEQEWQTATILRPESGTPSVIFGHFPVHQGQAELCKDSQSLTEVFGSCDVMRNDASCNEVIQSKEMTSLGLEPRTYGLKVCCSTN
jgi:integrase